MKLRCGGVLAVSLYILPTGCAKPATVVKDPADVDPPTSRAAKSGSNGALPDQPPMLELAAGSRICLAPIEMVERGAVSGNRRGQADFDRVSFTALLRIALRQSAHLDIEPDPQAASSDLTIVVHVDSRAQRASSSLLRPGLAPLPLASVSTQPGLVPTADQLAIRTRMALGDRPKQTPVSCAQLLSARPKCIRASLAGDRALSRGQVPTAVAKLRLARRFDGGCTYNLMLLATALVAVGGTEQLREAQDIVTEALRMQNRLAPTTLHRLLRVRALAERDDGRLLQLGESWRGDRPFDPHGLYTKALALSLLNRTKDAMPLLEELAARWPQNGSVQFRLGYARLAHGQPKMALECFAKAAKRLPPHVCVRPTALALFHAGEHDKLRNFLAALSKRPRVQKTAALHEVRRMQIAHALLQTKPNEAERLLLEDMAWIRQHPHSLDRYTLDVAENGEVLVRINRAKQLMNVIRGFQQLGRLPKTFRASLTYLGGLYSIWRNKDPKAAATTLERDGRATWSHMLRAAYHQKRGELRDEARALEQAMGGTTSALVFARYSRVMRRAGEVERAKSVAKTLRSSLLTFHQRRPYEHPLMSPARALAWVALVE